MMNAKRHLKNFWWRVMAMVLAAVAALSAGLFGIPPAALAERLGDFVNTVPSDPEDDVTFTAQDRDIETGYLLRENFYQNSLSGWERENLVSKLGETSVVSSTVTGVEVSLRKKFVPQTNDVTMELMVMLVDNVSHGSIRLMGTRGGETVPAALIEIRGNHLYFGDTEVGELFFGNWLGIKLVANASEGTVDVLICGESKLSGAALTNDVDDVSEVYFGIDEDGTGKFRLGNLFVYKGYSIYEDFISVSTGSKFVPGTDYNQTARLESYGENGAISDNNRSMLGNLVDGNLETKWVHDTRYSPHWASVRSVLGQLTPVDTITLIFADTFSGDLNLSYVNSAGSWESIFYEHLDIAEGKKTNGPSYRADGFNMTISLSDVVYATTVSVNFVESDGHPIKDKKIELAEFKVVCNTTVFDVPARLPDDWENEGEVIAHEYAPFNGQYEFNVLKLEGDAVASKQFSGAESVTAEFMALFETTANGNFLGIKDADGKAFGISTDCGKLVFNEYNASGSIVATTALVNAENAFTGYQKDLWYRFNLRMNAEADAVEVCVNGWAPVGWVSLRQTYAAWERFEIRNTSGRAYADALRVYDTLAESEVPDVTPLDTGDSVLTMQACTLWREGTQSGWARLDRSEIEGRKPILGFYDEGSAEVADWEIKIAREHGISNFMYCWYRMDNGPGPIHSSIMADELWEGIFKSKFRDQMHFSIMYTDSPYYPSYTREDFMQNVVPYWIETFFKNDNYFKTADGVPVFYIYDYNQFAVEMDGNATSALNEMRQMCIDAGLPGLYVATEHRGGGDVVQNMASAGYDGVFAYTWTPGTDNMNNDEILAMTKDRMQSQINAVAALKPSDLPEKVGAIEGLPAFSFLPNISRNWDQRGWEEDGSNESTPKYTYDLEHYRQLATYVRDTVGGATLDTKGTKLIMLDNWNEFGEGHWLFPTYNLPAYKEGTVGYGFLDVLRETFGIGQYAHTDHLPVEEGFGPYDTWYPSAWDKPANQWGKVTVDESVEDATAIDGALGGNTVLRGTAYEPEKSVNGKLFRYETANAARVVISAADVAAAKASASAIEIEMKAGTIRIPAASLWILADGKPLEAVLSTMLDVSDEAALFAKDLPYGFAGSALEFSLKQGGFAVSVADVTLSVAKQSGTDDLAVVRGGAAVKRNLATSEGKFVLSVTSNCKIVAVRHY